MNTLIFSNEKGYVLVLTLLLMVVVALLGASAIKNAVFESNMAANDALYKKAFYQADGGADIGIKLTFDNAICEETNDGFDDDGGGTATPTGTTILVSDLEFAAPQTLASTDISDTNRHAVYYLDTMNDSRPHTNLLVEGDSSYTPGAGLQMVSGYEGLGAGSIGGGTQLDYDIYSQHHGERRSEALITVGWKLSAHILNNAAASDCNTIYTN